MTHATGIAGAILAAVAWAAPASAEAKTYRSEYSVSLYGLTIGRSNFSSRFQGDRFEIQGSVSSAGLAKVFDSTKGTTTVSGRFRPDGGTRPDGFVMDYTSGRKVQKIAVQFSGGAVTNTTVTPAPKKRGATWVAVSDEHLRSVADPISATLVKADADEDVCRRTIRLYDGEMRADLELSPTGRGAVSVGGYTGDAVTCSARFVPVSGYRTDHKSTAYLRDRSRIEIAFARLGETGIYAPVKASIGTEIGTVNIQVEKLESVD